MKLDVFMYLYTIYLIIIQLFYYSRFVKWYYMILESNCVKVPFQIMYRHERRGESKNKNEN